MTQYKRPPSIHTPKDLADALIRVGNRSLWADLEGLPDNRVPRRVAPRAVRDLRAETLLLGSMLTYAASRRAALATGLACRHFSTLDNATLYGRILTMRNHWNLESLEPLTAIRLIDDFADAAEQVATQLWEEWQSHFQGPLPHVDAALAAQGLAERVLRLALAREHLQTVDQLLAGTGAAPVDTRSNGVRL